MKVDNLSFLYALGNIGDDLVVEAVEVYSLPKVETSTSRRCFRSAIAVAAACFVVVFMMIVINRMNIDLPIDETLTTDSQENGNYHSSDKSMTIKINELKDVPTLSYMLPMRGEDNFKPMNEKDLFAYYGIYLDMSKIVPSGMVENLLNDLYAHGIYTYPDGTVDDQNVFYYQSENDAAQTISVSIKKGNIPCFFVVKAYDRKLEKSSVNDTEMTIAHYNDVDGQDTYYAEFMYKGLGFAITTTNLSKEALINALQYITAQ